MKGPKVNLLRGYLRRQKARASRVLAAMCLILVVIVCSGWPARATLRIATGCPHGSLFQRIYEQFPEVFKSRSTLLVREVSDEEMDQLVGEHERDLQHNGNSDQGVVDAFYQSAQSERDPTPSITIRRMLPEYSSPFIFTHEYGHYVWYAKLNRGQRGDFKRIWREQKRAGCLITRYAGEDEYEGFAEAFAYYLRNPAKLKRVDSESWEFLDGIERSLRSGSRTPQQP